MLKILGRQSSANVQKVTWLCDECDIAYLREDVDYHAPQYLEFNPNAKIPTAIDADFVIWESHAILQYLCAKHELDAWNPIDLRAGTRVRQWMDWASGECYRAAEPVWIGMVLTPAEQRDVAAIERARIVLSKKVAMLDQRLAGNNYVAGDTITIADMPLAIFTYRWLEMPIEHENFPNLRRWYDAIAARPAFRKSVIDIGIYR